ncbi:MAG: carboxypeptidase regulatory-like domain-containing protein [bacterium]
MNFLNKFAVLPLIAFSYPLFAQNTSNLHLLKSIDPVPVPGDPRRYGEVTGCGDLAAIAGWYFDDNSRNVYLYDVSTPQAPRQLAVVPSTAAIWDVQIHGRYLYFAVQNQGYIDVYDLIDPVHPVLVNHFQPGDPSISPHTFWVTGRGLYIANHLVPGVTVFDLTNKRSFVYMGLFNNDFGTAHDNTVIHNKLYTAFIFSPAGLWTADVSDLSAPKPLAGAQYPGAGTHNAWPTEDERYILTTDEIGATEHNLKIWDTQSGALELVAEYATQPGAIIHNVYVRGRYAYLSYYCEGIRIVDINDPRHPVQVASYDLNGNTPCSGYSSTWGIYPFSRYIYASDMNLGLHLFDFDQHPPANLTGAVTDAVTGAAIPGAYVYFPDEYATTRTSANGAYEIPWFKDDHVRVAADALGYQADTLETNTTADGNTELNFALRKSSTAVDEKPENMPQKFALHANYPNPFNPATTITYDLPGAAHVMLKIYDMLGQEVRTLIDAWQEAGSTSLTWDGRDHAGQILPSGVYFYRLQAEGFAQTRKLVVMR